MSEYKMVPVVATAEMLLAMHYAQKIPCDYCVNGVGLVYPDEGRKLYAEAIAAAPPFVVTDEMVKRAMVAFYAGGGAKASTEDDGIRAAIEAVLGGAK